MSSEYVHKDMNLYLHVDVSYIEGNFDFKNDWSIFFCLIFSLDILYKKIGCCCEK